MTAPSKTQILALLRKKNRAIHPGEMAGRLGLTEAGRKALGRLLLALVSEGLVTELPGGRFRAKPSREKKSSPPKKTRKSSRVGRPAGNEVVGRLTMHPAGFGFLAPEQGGQDVFVPPAGMATAVHGDLVRASTRASRKGIEGEIQEVVQRGLRQLTGRLESVGKGFRFLPDDPRFPTPLEVQKPLPKKVDLQTAFVAKWVQYPGRQENGRVVLISKLGPLGATSVEVEKLKLRDGVVEAFDSETEQEADRFGDRIRASDRAGREDLRSIDLCTIDPVDARDHDDAVWVKKQRDGSFQVVVAIADVSHYVTPGSHLDASARERGCSIYLPDRAIPMLPAALSSNLASLKARKDRLCVALHLHVGPHGGVRAYRLSEAVMRSHASLTYEGVAWALGLSEKPHRQPAAEQRRGMLKAMRELATVLRARRIRQGALDFDLPEGRVRFGENGEPEDVYQTKADPGVKQAYRMVEELMLLANEVVAKELTEKNIPTIYRVHGQPDEKKLELFCELASALGYNIDPEQASNPRLLSKFLRRLDGTPHSAPLGMLLLRAMQQAVYDTNNIGHFGLGAKHYLHFTSPIRRYPDLEVHRIVRDLIRAKTPARPAPGHRSETDAMASHTAELQRSAVESSRLERRATGLERDVLALYRAVLMMDRIGDVVDATISGVAPHGFYSTVESPFVDLFTPIESLGSQVEMDRLHIRLSARRSGTQWALGDQVTLRVEEVSLERREIVATTVGESVASSAFDQIPLTYQRSPRALRSTGARKPEAKNRRDDKSRRRRRAERRQNDDTQGSRRPRNTGRRRKR